MAEINLLPEELKSGAPNGKKRKQINTKQAIAPNAPPMFNIAASPASARDKSRPILQSKPSSRPKISSRITVRKKGPAQAGPEVNFIPELKLPLSREALMSRLIFGLILLLVEAAVISGGYFIFSQYLRGQKNKIDQIVLQTKKAEEEIKSYIEDQKEGLSLRNRLVALNSLLEGHIHWTNFLKFLEENTLPEIFYGSAISEGARVTLIGRAPDFKSVAKQLIVFNGLTDLIGQSSITNLSIVDQETPQGIVKLVGFNLNLTAKSDFLKRK